MCSEAGGNRIALRFAEARSRAMCSADSPKMDTAAGCAEHNRLLNEFGEAVHELLALHEQKQASKYAYLRHVEQHGCSKI